MSALATDVPHGYCHCGCGQKTNIAKRNNAWRGHIKGEPVRYVAHHGGHRNGGVKHPGWKGDEATPQAKRTRAQRLIKVLGPCERCGEAPAVDRHHIDGDPGNNAADNMAEDGRLERGRRGNPT